MRLRRSVISFAALVAMAGARDAVAGQSDIMGPERRLWVPEGCTDTPRRGIDSSPGSLRCAGESVVVIQYDHGFAAGDRCRGRGIDGTPPTGGAPIRLCASDGGKQLVASLPEQHMNFYVMEPAPPDAIAFLKVVRDVAARFRPTWMPPDGDLPR